MGTKLFSLTPTLTEKLRELRFYRVPVGSPDICGGMNNPVREGLSRTWARNNGVTVVYDDGRTPWVTNWRNTNCSDGDDPQFAQMISVYGLTYGARVPYSNDGGKRIMEVAREMNWQGVR